LDFYELDTDFYLKLQNYLINQTIKIDKVDKPKYSNTTISKIISQFRQFLIWSKKNKYVSEIDIDYRTKLPVSYKQVITLDEKQIKELTDFDEFDYEYKSTPLTKVPPYLKHYESWNNENYLVTEELRVVLKSKDGESLRNEKGELVGDELSGKTRTYTTYELTKDIFLFSISTGLRWSDVVQIKINDYDYLKNTFSLLQQKTSMYVSIMENKLSKHIWKKYSKNKSFTQYLFPLPCKENDRSRINYNTKINHHLKQVGKILGFNNTVEVVTMNGKDMTKNKVPLYSVISFHMGRKTHSTIGIKKGVDEFSISKQMGHTSLGQTKNYVGSNSEKLEKMFDFIEEDLKDIKNTVHKSDNTIKVKLSPEEVDKELELLKSRYDRKLITKKVYEEKMKELI
jgi:integrase